jgi:protease IV
VRFLKSVWSFFTKAKGVFGTLLFIALIVLVVRLIFSDSRPDVPGTAALRITLDGFVVEQKAEIDPFEALASPAGDLPQQTLLRDVEDALKRAKDDKRITAVTLELDNFFGAGPATLRAIGAAINDFKRSGKPVIAHATYYGNDQYYVAAHATEVLLDPIGAAAVTGLAAYNPYLKTLLDNFDVTVNVFKVGTFKSAVEPFTRSDASPEAKENLQTLLDGIWQTLSADIQTQRSKKGLTNLANVINGMPAGVQAAKGDLAAYALTSKMVDGLASRSDFIDRMIEKVGDGEDQSGLSSFSQIDMASYLAATADLAPKSGDAIAVVYAVGEIIDGDEPAGVAAGDTIARQIRTAVDNADTKAIVLRVDSPGGSVTASEVIRLELERAKKLNIPVVASYGALAASGGYWISAGANEIWADPATITGSIGIFAMIPTFEKTLARYGVNSDGVSTTPLADFGDITRPLSEPIRQVLQASIENGYDNFLTRVSQGRKLDKAKVDTIAQGRVWSGGAAHQLKLVDRLGGLNEAIESAAKRANLTSWRVAVIEDEPDWKTKLLSDLISGPAAKATTRPAAGWALAAQSQRALQLLASQPRLSDPSNLYAWCLECAVLSPRPTPQVSTAALAALAQR